MRRDDCLHERVVLDGGVGKMRVGQERIISRVQNRGAGKDHWWDALPREEWSAFEKVEQDQDWFEVYRVADGVFALVEPRQFQETISYLVVGTNRALLFDTGLGLFPIRPVVEELTTKPVDVLNSHTHFDHVGGNAGFEGVLAWNSAYTRANARGFPRRKASGRSRARRPGR